MMQNKLFNLKKYEHNKEEIFNFLTCINFKHTLLMMETGIWDKKNKLILI